MAPRQVQLVLQILLFLLATLLGVASSYLTNSGSPIAALHWVQRFSLPLAGFMILVIIVTMVVQHQQEIRIGRPVWNSTRSPFPGLEAFTESDAGVFFGRDGEISELAELLHPHVPAKAHRFVVVTGPSGVGKTSLVQAGLIGWQALAAVAIVGALVHLVARPVPGLGIAVPRCCRGSSPRWSR